MKFAGKLACISALAALLALPAYAQTVMKGISMYGSGDINSASLLKPYAFKNFPVLDVDSSDLQCRSHSYSSSTSSDFKMSAPSTITFWWDKDSGSLIGNENNGNNGIYGPCTVYMSKVDSSGKPTTWFKIYGSGFANNHWCTATVKGDNDGRLDVQIPSDIKAGRYLLRAEIINLKYATKSNWDDYTLGPQFFPNCFYVNVSGGGSAEPSGVKIPGVYKNSDKSLVGDFSAAGASYKVPGPAEYKPGSA